MMSSALRSAAIRNAQMSNAIRSQAIRDAVTRAIIARQAAQKEAARRDAIKREMSVRQMAINNAIRQSVAVKNAILKKTAQNKFLRQAAFKKASAWQSRAAAQKNTVRFQQKIQKQKQQHAKRVVDGRAIATRVRQVVNYGLGARINHSARLKTSYAKAMRNRVQAYKLPAKRPIFNIKSSPNSQKASAPTQKVNSHNQGSVQLNKTSSQNQKNTINKQNSIKHLPINKQIENIFQKRKEISLQKLSTREIAKKLIDSNKEARKAKQEKSEKEKFIRMIEIFKAKDIASKKTTAQKDASKGILCVTNNTITSETQTKGINKQKRVKENFSKETAATKNSTIQQAKQLKTNSVKKIVTNSKINRKQTQPKIGTITPAILHSYRALNTKEGKGPEARRSTRIAEHSHDNNDGDYDSDSSGSDSEDEKDLRPDESKQATDGSSRFIWGENKEEFQYQFRTVNPRFPANKDVINELKSSKMREMIEDDNTDCSEIAERLYNACGGKGSIITIKPQKRMDDIFIGEKKEGGYEPKSYIYHTVFRDNHYVYDPCLSKNPIPRGDYQSIINKLNPQGVKVHEGDPWSEVKVERRGILVNKTGKI